LHLKKLKGGKKMERVRKNLLWIAMIAGMMLLGSAISITVTSEAEAINALKDKPTIALLDGEVHSCEKTVKSSEEVSSKPYTVTYSTWYTRNGVKTREGVGIIELSNCNETTIKNAMKPVFDAEGAAITAKYDVAYDQVIIVPKEQPLSEVYDLVQRIWKSKTAQMEP